MHYTTTYDSPLGTMTLATNGQHLTGLWLAGQKYHARTLAADALPKDDYPLFSTTKKWLDQYFAAQQPALNTLPLAPQGTSFRQQVWRILCDIPYGQTLTYRDVAHEMAKRMGRNSMSSQAVGGAVGHNPISVIIPCHRVVGADGSLTGYAGGIAAKIELLKLEGVDLSPFFIPKKSTAP